MNSDDLVTRLRVLAITARRDWLKLNQQRTAETLEEAADRINELQAELQSWKGAYAKDTARRA